jgi:predicted DNA-binding protein
LEQLEKITDKKKDYYVKESLYRYLEDLEDYEIGIQALKSQGPTFTSEEVKKHLKEHYNQK